MCWTDIYKALLIAVFIIQIRCSDDDLPNKTFRCKNGEYVRNTTVCSSYSRSCSDGSNADTLKCKADTVPEDDIQMSLNTTVSTRYRYSTRLRIRCSSGTFMCLNSTKCIDANLHCDTKVDCADGSDENECGDEVHVNNCSLNDGKFLCKDKLRCLDLEHACDGECNCFDCSDENENCSRVDYGVLEECPHTYFPTPLGPRCFCDPKNKASSSICDKIKDCTGQGICHQKCSMYKNKPLCSCYDDFIEIPGTNGFRCQSETYYGNSIVYTTSNQIKFLNLTTREITVVKSEVQCASVVASKDEVFYTTFHDDRTSIFKYSTIFKLTDQVVKSNTSIISIAIDYNTQNIYFTTNTSLSACTKDGRTCTQLKCCDVRNIVLAPKFGLMFYTKKSDYQDERFIMKANMNGSNEEVMVDGTYRGNILMAVDESIQRLYWSVVDDSKIYSVSFPGSSNEIRSVSCPWNLIAISAFDSRIFYTKLRENQIYNIQYEEYFTKRASYQRDYMYESYTYRTTPSPQRNSSHFNDNNLTVAIRYIHAYNPHQQFKVENPCAKVSCSGICLLSPGSSKKNLNYNCITQNISLTNQFRSTVVAPKTQSITIVTPKTPFSEKQTTTQESQSHPILTTLLVIGLLIAALYAVYFAYQKRNLMSYYLTMRDWRSSKAGGTVNISEQEGY